MPSTAAKASWESTDTSHCLMPRMPRVPRAYSHAEDKFGARKKIQAKTARWNVTAILRKRTKKASPRCATQLGSGTAELTDRADRDEFISRNSCGIAQSA